MKYDNNYGVDDDNDNNNNNNKDTVTGVKVYSATRCRNLTRPLAGVIV
jgi:hypothetical protein